MDQLEKALEEQIKSMEAGVAANSTNIVLLSLAVVILAVALLQQRQRVHILTAGGVFDEKLAVLCQSLRSDIFLEAKTSLIAGSSPTPNTRGTEDGTVQAADEKPTTEEEEHNGGNASFDQLIDDHLE